MRAISSHTPDAFLSDHGLPAFDGFEALHIAQQRCPQAPFIFVSRGMTADEIQRAFRHGAADFVSKEDLGALVPTIARSLGKDAPRRNATTLAAPATRPAPSQSHAAAASAQVAGKRLQLFVEVIDEESPLYLLDPDGKIIAWNAGARRALGYTADEVIGQPECSFCSGEDIGEGTPGKARSTSTQRQTHSARIRKDGTRCEVDVNVTPLRDTSGEVLGSVVVLREVSPARGNAAPAPDRTLEEAIRAIPSRRSASARRNASDAGDSTPRIVVDEKAPETNGRVSATELTFDNGDEATAAFEAAVAEIVLSPSRAGFHTLTRAQLLRLTRSMRNLDLVPATRELRLTEESTRLSAWRRRLIDDEASSKKRMQLIASAFAENKRTYR